MATLVGQESLAGLRRFEKHGESCHRDTPGHRVEATKQVDKVQIPSGVPLLLFDAIPVATASQTGFTVYGLPTQEGCHIPRLWAKLPHSLLVSSLAKALYNKGVVLYICLPTEVISATLLLSQSPSKVLKINRTLSGCSELWCPETSGQRLPP